MNSVFAKWASARTELVGKKIEEGEGEGEGEEEDVETVEQRKKVEIEQWRTEQLKTYAPPSLSPSPPLPSSLPLFSHELQGRIRYQQCQLRACGNGLAGTSGTC